MSIKLHFPRSLYYFPQSSGELSEKQGQSFLPDIHIMKEHYQGRTKF